MSERPYLRFWVSDWLGSTKRRGMTLAETGAYINLLASAWQSEDCSLPADDAVLARLSEAHGDWPKVRDRVRACFYVVDDSLFNEKLDKEADYFMKQRANGNRSKGRPPNPKITQPITQPITQKEVSHKPESISHKPEIRDQKEKPPSSASPKGVCVFDGFWKAYPRKVGKEAARKAWAKLKLDAESNKILAGITRCKTSEQWRKDGGKYIPHPTTWLNRGGWDDEPDPPKPPQNGNWHAARVDVCTLCTGAGAYKDTNGNWRLCQCGRATQADVDAANGRTL